MNNQIKKEERRKQREKIKKGADRISLVCSGLAIIFILLIIQEIIKGFI